MMPGLLEGQEKMSKSDPNSAIFMEDTEAEVRGGRGRWAWPDVGWVWLWVGVVWC